MVLNPKESAKLIAKLASFIKIKQEGIEKLGDELIKNVESGSLSIKNFSQNNYHPSFEQPWAIDWLFVVDSLNYCFWSNEHEQGWAVNGKTGYFALCMAINRAMKEGVDILNPSYYSNITETDLAKVLRSDNNVQVPLFNERLKSLHEAGSVLLEKFNGSFVNCVKVADRSAVKLLDLIVTNFPCYRDEADYKGHRVSLYKRAQILIADIWSCFRTEGLGRFDDIDEIAMFADYRVPQSLLYYGVLEYTKELNDVLKKNVQLENGDEREVEIRGCSIEAVELLKDYVVGKIGEKKINSIMIDHFLWDFRRAHAKEILEMGLPFHKTYCVYY